MKIHASLFMLAVSLALSGCAGKPASQITKDCHGLNVPWEKSCFCRASVCSSQSSAVALGKQGIQIADFPHKTILLIPSDAIFEINSAEVKPEADPILAKLLTFLKQYSSRRIDVIANTDHIASVEQNRKLSTQQATEITGYLWDNGINTTPLNNQIELTGVGDEFPIATNQKLSGMATNRRIEIIIYDQENPKPAKTSRADIATYLKNKKCYTK